MRFDRISLRNFKPYGTTDLRLTDGVTVIHGLNGGGKSSLLEAAFFALYGSSALDGTLADVVTNGEEESDVALWFTHEGESYHVRRELRTHGDRVTTATCVLERDGEVIRDGANAVERFVRDSLRMDADAFVNCAYVKQGQVNKLIDASPADRQRMIDDLLQLGRLEEYRDRAGEARLAVEKVLDGRREVLSDLDDRIERKEAKDLPARVNTLESELSTVDEEIDDYQTQKEKAESTREEARRVLDEQEESRAELANVEETITEIEAAIRETEAEREELAERIADHRAWLDEARDEHRDRLDATELADPDPDHVEDRLSELSERRSSLREELSEARSDRERQEQRRETARETAQEADSRAADEREEADAVAETTEAEREELSQREDRLAETDERIAETEERFADAPVGPDEADDHLAAVESEAERLREERSDVQAELRAARESITEAEELLADGNCPKCGQPVEGAPNVESLASNRAEATRLEERLDELDERAEELLSEKQRAESLAESATELERLRERRGDRAQAVADKRTDVDRLTERADRLREAAAEAEQEAERAREEAAAADDRVAELADRIAELESEIEACDEAKRRVEAVAELREEIADRESEIERLDDRRAELASRNDERRDRLAERRERRAELAAAVDEERVERARQRLAKADQYIDRVTEKLAELDERRDRLREQIGSVRNELDELDEIRERRGAVAERVDALESLHEETTRLETTYGDLRAELRRRNVAELERTLNETFELVYANDAYSHIELDGEYDLTVYQKNGEPLDPDQLSGGERALFNLSLRCGIYRLLTEGIEGETPTPPLILDEPTVFLDDGHVSRLVDLVAEMRGFGVSQIVIVSHDDELVGAADELVRVEKDPTTNRSTARRVDDASLAAMERVADD